MVYFYKVKKSRLKNKKKLFHRGHLVFTKKEKSSFFNDIVALWNTHPTFISESGMMSWDGPISITSYVNSKDILLVINIHELFEPQERQYCQVMCFRTNESGWVTSESLEKVE